LLRTVPASAVMFWTVERTKTLLTGYGLWVLILCIPTWSIMLWYDTYMSLDRYYAFSNILFVDIGIPSIGGDDTDLVLCVKWAFKNI
jgi:hypothetical protein